MSEDIDEVYRKEREGGSIPKEKRESAIGYSLSTLTLK